MAFALGDENKLNPNPVIINAVIKVEIALSIFNDPNRNNPHAVIAIPTDAIILGSSLSDKRPTKGEKIAIVKGWTIIMLPVIVADRPFKYCKYKLTKTMFAKTAV